MKVKFSVEPSWITETGQAYSHNSIAIATSQTLSSLKPSHCTTKHLRQEYCLFGQTNSMFTVFSTLCFKFYLTINWWCAFCLCKLTCKLYSTVLWTTVLIVSFLQGGNIEELSDNMSNKQQKLENRNRIMLCPVKCIGLSFWWPEDLFKLDRHATIPQCISPGPLMSVE